MSGSPGTCRAATSLYALKKYVLACDTTPNLVGYYLDDFFHIGIPGLIGTPKPAPASLSMEEMKQLHEETLAYKRPSGPGDRLERSKFYFRIRPVVNVDTVSLWIWSGGTRVEAN